MQIGRPDGARRLDTAGLVDDAGADALWMCCAPLKWQEVTVRIEFFSKQVVVISA